MLKLPTYSSQFLPLPKSSSLARSLISAMKVRPSQAMLAVRIDRHVGQVKTRAVALPGTVPFLAWGVGGAVSEFATARPETDRADGAFCVK